MKNNHINYIEFPAKDISLTKQFYQKAFNWKFEDYGPDYIAFSNAGIDGGFFKSEDPILNGALVILYHNDLTAI
ncbi:VOC family protein [Pedobacter sp. PWIIR3]